MKKFLTNNNIKNVVATIFFAAITVIGVNAAAQGLQDLTGGLQAVPVTTGTLTASINNGAPGSQDISPIIHLGSGDQKIDRFKVGNGSGTLGSLDLRGTSTSVAQFIGDSSLFTVLNASGLATTSGRVFVGNDSISTSIWQTTYSLIEGVLPVVMQRVNVLGEVRATNLQNASGNVKVCVEPNGDLTQCANVSISDTIVPPINGVCGSWDGQTTATNPATQASIFELCSSGTASSVGVGAGTYDWSCYGSNGGANATCSANQSLTYNWQEGDWGSCIGGSGSCSGTPVGGQGNKIDWNGNLFNWTDGNLHQVISPIAAFCGSNNDLLVGEHVHANGGINATACIIGPLGQFPSGVMYEVSVTRNSWDRHIVDANGTITAVQTNYAPAYQNGRRFRARCDVNGNGVYDDNAGVCPGGSTMSNGDWVGMNEWCSPTTNNSLPAAPGYNDPSGSQSICVLSNTSGGGSCNGTTSGSCISIAGCNWTPGSASTQTRPVVCKDSNGVTVADSFCPPPKPATSQACVGGTLGSGGLITSSCFIADTIVTMADGSTKPIQEVLIGDVLKGETSDNKVLAYDHPLLNERKLYSLNGGKYFVTAEHPFMTTNGWKSISPEATARENVGIDVAQLVIGDVLITDGAEVILKSINYKNDNPETQVYNFALDGDHTYYADGYLVHNKVQGGDPCSTSQACGFDGLQCIAGTCQ